MTVAPLLESLGALLELWRRQCTGEFQGREGSVLHFVPFWTSQPQWKSHLLPHLQK